MAAGPIPARAGQPQQLVAFLQPFGAYPRSRGATSGWAFYKYKDKGLSPLARGNRYKDALGRMRQGPIPARAGQPRRHGRSPRAAWAYPRSRGATSISMARTLDMWGLSPLARGNRHHLAVSVVQVGPIPARAGQPSFQPRGSCCPWAYPRSRGATVHLSVGIARRKGLSPLARGNRQHADARVVRPGPIPARAGQPASRAASASSRGAYPRSRGATLLSWLALLLFLGLSPLARGNPTGSQRLVTYSRPIPARAGQPHHAQVVVDACGAYPRSRGATGSGLCRRTGRGGLSPLARGNRRRSRRAQGASGPIPARAGQPQQCSAYRHARRAYPRSRGATQGF